MKTNAYKHRRDVQFKIGEEVYLKLRPYRQPSVVNQNNVKLAPGYFGQFDIVENFGKLTYKLKLLDTASIHLDGVRPSREKKDGQEVLIQWKNLPLYDASWEQFDYIELQFP
ncbi:ty3-gypsy retrotransposon protein, partial [Tanacetum coccineum]